VAESPVLLLHSIRPFFNTQLIVLFSHVTFSPKNVALGF
jgi:hypothetical protein